MKERPKITTGPNERARNETIGQTGPGIPDDTSRPVDVDDASVERFRRQMQAGTGRERQMSGEGGANPDIVPKGTPGAGENICRRCAGRGSIDGEPCPDCGGSGIVTTPVGGGG